MIERQVHHRIHAGRSAAQAVDVRKVSAVHLGASSLQLLHAGIAARKSTHSVTHLDQLLHQPCSNETCCSRHKYTHCHPPVVVTRSGKIARIDICVFVG